jgi:hypothetical protein
MFLEIDNHSAGQETPHLLQNMKIYYCLQKSPPLDFIPS